VNGPTALVDVRPLRVHPEFRRLWIGTTASGFGSQFTSFAVAYFVWTTTRNPAMVGAIGLASAAPLIVFALVGASFADAVDRRRLVILTTCGQIVTSASMALLSTRSGGAVWPMFGLVAVSSGLSAIGFPARRALVPRLLPKERLQAGLALNHMSFQLAMLVGPTVAGLVTARWGTTACFAIDALTFAAGLYGVTSLHTAAPASGESRPGWRAVADAARLVARVPALAGAFLSDLCATVLAMPMALFPVLNQDKFGGSPQTLGFLLSAVAVGGVTAAALSGLVTHRQRTGVVLLACGAVWGVSLAGVGLTGSLAVVLVLLGVAGAADTWAVISRGTIVQLTTPESYRGRVSAMEHVVGAAGPQLGNFRAGLVAAASSGNVAIVTGGVACLLSMALLATRVPALRRFRVSSAATGDVEVGPQR
jgi:MFS family permease